MTEARITLAATRFPEEVPASQKSAREPNEESDMIYLFIWVAFTCHHRGVAKDSNLIGHIDKVTGFRAC
jgi:hypothetical protein